MSKVIGLLIGLAAVFAAPPAHATHPEPFCSRFALVEPVGPPGMTLREITVVGDEVTLNGRCVSRKARVHRGRRGVRIRAAFGTCGDAHGVRLRARVDVECTAMRGVIRTRKPRHRARFEARPISDPGHGCGTIAGIPCPDGFHCDFAPGLCGVSDLGGMCVATPTGGCPEIYAPECGCDGVTYSNECERLAARAQLDHPGRCECLPIVCAPGTEPVDTDRDGCPDACVGGVCRSSADCGDDEVCKKRLGDCGGEGRCAPKPFGCPDVWDPVCGCDGVTHSNACDAAQAGTSIAHEGECRQMCDGFAGLQCPEGQFCDHPPGMCLGADVAGMCVPRSDACPLIFDPVCGCDGTTYSNDCERIASSAQKAHDGPCDCRSLECPPDTMPVDRNGDGCPDDCVSGRCETNDHCADREFCATEPGTCGGIAWCEPRPDACLDIYDPVCGCDGKTYGNACEAAHLGASIAHPGPCECDRLICPLGSDPTDVDGDHCPDYCTIPPCTVRCDGADCSTVCPALQPE